MKSKTLILFLLFLTTFSLISAVQVDMKSDLAQGETLLAKVSGNFVNSLNSENILLYRDHVRIPFLSSVKKIEGEYYIYGQLSGRESGNYSLRISNIQYIEGGETKDDEIVREFEITNESADFLINPGFIQTDNDFFIEVENLQSTKIIVESKLLDDSVEFSENETVGFFEALFGSGNNVDSVEWNETEINPGEKKNIKFDVTEVNSSALMNAVLKTQNILYEVPSFIEISEGEEENEELEIQPSKSTISMSTDTETSRFIYLYNSGNVDLYNLTFSISNEIKPYVFISNQSFDIKENSTEKIEINFSSGEEDGFVEGQLTVTNGETYAYMKLSLNISESYVPAEGYEDESLFQTCEALEGEFCDNGELCNGETENAKNGVCCLGNCEPEDTNNQAKRKIIGWILIIFIFSLVIWFFLSKYKGVKRPSDLLKILKKD